MKVLPVLREASGSRSCDAGHIDAGVDVIPRVSGIRFGRELPDEDEVPPQAFVVGEQPWWELVAWDTTVARSAGLRSQLRRAARRSVRVRATAAVELTHGAPLRGSLEDLFKGWLATRRLPPLRFSDDLAPFDAPGRLVVIAVVDGEIVAAAFARPWTSSTDWMVDHIIRQPHTPQGTTEALIDAVFRAARDAGATWATLGLCALFGRVGPFLRWARGPCSVLYDFAGLASFRARLHPQRWRRVLVEHPNQTSLQATLRVLRALAGGSLLRFGWAALMRLPARWGAGASGAPLSGAPMRGIR
jgi:lysylphosphatidylglycerol synthetase-like protein (DUF2156 family)